MTQTKRTVQKVSSAFLLDTRVNFLAAPPGAAPPEGPGLEAGAGADGRHRQVIIPGQKKSPRQMRGQLNLHHRRMGGAALY